MPPIDVTVPMRPCPRRRMPGSTASAAWIGPRVIVSMASS